MVSWSDIKVADLMNTDVVTLSEEDSLDVAEQSMRFAKIHHLPVVDGHGKMLGMIAQSDILRAQVSVFAELSVSEDRAIKQEILAKDVMVRNLTTVAPETSALQAARLLAGRRRAPRRHRVGPPIRRGAGLRWRRRGR